MLVRRPPSHQAAWLLLKDADNLTAEEQAFLDSLWNQCPKIRSSAETAQQFTEIVRERRVERLEDWILRTHQADMPRELRVFADGLQQDFAAVKAALSLEWSNGQVEGQVNRLRLIKRQMYGRGGFELLRRRVLEHRLVSAILSVGSQDNRKTQYCTR